MFVDAVGVQFDLGAVQTCFLKRFRILSENDRQGEVVITEGGHRLPGCEAARTQAEMSLRVDGDDYGVTYLVGGSGIDCREPYSESEMVGSHSLAEQDVMQVRMKAWDHFESWIRAIVATNKVFCEHLFGPQPYRWVSLSSLDIALILRSITEQPCVLELRHTNYKAGIGGKNYAVNRARLETPVGVSDFEICFCY
jgi:hypothetical protein